MSILLLFHKGNNFSFWVQTVALVIRTAVSMLNVKNKVTFQYSYRGIHQCVLASLDACIPPWSSNVLQYPSNVHLRLKDFKSKFHNLLANTSIVDVYHFSPAETQMSSFQCS